jgi:hypothetical protein
VIRVLPARVAEYMHLTSVRDVFLSVMNQRLSSGEIIIFQYEPWVLVIVGEAHLLRDIKAGTEMGTRRGMGQVLQICRCLILHTVDSTCNITGQIRSIKDKIHHITGQSHNITDRTHNTTGRICNIIDQMHYTTDPIRNIVDPHSSDVSDWIDH